MHCELSLLAKCIGLCMSSLQYMIQRRCEPESLQVWATAFIVIEQQHCVANNPFAYIVSHNVENVHNRYECHGASLVPLCLAFWTMCCECLPRCIDVSSCTARNWKIALLTPTGKNQLRHRWSTSKSGDIATLPKFLAKGCVEITPLWGYRLI